MYSRLTHAVMGTQAKFFAEKPFELWTLHGGQKVGDKHFIFSRSYDELEESFEPPELPPESSLVNAPWSRRRPRPTSSTGSRAATIAKMAEEPTKQRISRNSTRPLARLASTIKHTPETWSTRRWRWRARRRPRRRRRPALRCRADGDVQEPARRGGGEPLDESTGGDGEGAARPPSLGHQRVVRRRGPRRGPV